MKASPLNLVNRFTALFFCLALSFAFTPAAQAEEIRMQPAKWDKLGTRKVNRSLDKDEIIVTGRDGLFSKVKLGVKRSGINMHKMVIHFRNGDKQNVQLRNNIPAGGSTRVIDLKGGKRVIKKVVFWYDTKGIINNKAVIELWGRR